MICLNNGYLLHIQIVLVSIKVSQPFHVERRNPLDCASPASVHGYRYSSIYIEAVRK